MSTWLRVIGPMYRNLQKLLGNFLKQKMNFLVLANVLTSGLATITIIGVG